MVDTSTWKNYTVKEISSNPSNFLNKKVQVAGKLVLVGKNYFTDSRFAVTDGTNQLRINSWLPLEIHSSAVGSRNSVQPKTMEGYLNKDVTLEGTIEQDGLGFLLVVTKAI